MFSNFRVTSTLFLVSLLMGTASIASAANNAKSWEVDLYEDEVELTYVDDGYDDITVYDHSDTEYNSNQGYESDFSLSGTRADYYDNRYEYQNSQYQDSQYQNDDYCDDYSDNRRYSRQLSRGYSGW